MRILWTFCVSSLRDDGGTSARTASGKLPVSGVHLSINIQHSFISESFVLAKTESGELFCFL